MIENGISFNQFRPNIPLHDNAFHMKVYGKVLSSISGKAKLFAE